MDPLGLPLENLDGAGRWRDKENGKTLDVRGELTGTDKDGAFLGPAGMAARLGESATVHSCAVRTLFRFAFGRSETRQDACTLQALNAAFMRSGGKMRPFLAEVATSDAFFTRTIEGGAP